VRIEERLFLRVYIFVKNNTQVTESLEFIRIDDAASTTSVFIKPSEDIKLILIDTAVFIDSMQSAYGHSLREMLATVL
jgi:hypothetical protein